MTATRRHPLNSLRALLIAACASLPVVVTLLAAPTALASPRVWDISSDFAVSAPRQHNPQGDSYGDAGVWEFLHLHTTAETVPTETGEFEALGGFGACFGARTGFYVAGDCTTPGAAIGANRSGAAVATWEDGLENGQVALYPGDSDWSILAWHSPITGSVELLAGLASQDPSHSSRWAVLKASAPGATAIPIWGGEQSGTGTEVAGTEGVPLSVSTGEVIYVAVGPGEHDAWRHDETELIFTVEEAGGGGSEPGGGGSGGAPTGGAPASPAPAPPGGGAPSTGLGTPLGQQLEAHYGLTEARPAPVTTTDVPVDFTPYFGDALKQGKRGGPLRVGDSGAKGGEPHYWTLGEAQEYASELTGAGVSAPTALRNKLCPGGAAACRKVKSNIVLALRPEKKEQADEQILEGVCAAHACGDQAKHVAAEVEPFQILDESPNPAEPGAWQGTTTEPVTVRLYYWDPSLESKALPKPTPADPGPCGPLWDLAVSGRLPYTPATIKLLNEYQAKGCHWKLDPKVVDKSTVAQPTIVGVDTEKRPTTIGLTLWVPKAVPLTLGLTSFRSNISFPGFTQGWKVAAGVPDEISVVIGERGAVTDSAGNPIGTLAGIAVGVYYDKPGGGLSSTPLTTSRTNSRGEATLNFEAPAAGTVRVIATGQPASGPGLSGWASFPAVDPPQCFQSTSGLFWVLDKARPGVRGSRAHYVSNGLVDGRRILYTDCSGRAHASAARAASAHIARASSSNGFLCAILGWTGLMNCNEVGAPAPARTSPAAAKQPCAPSQLILGAPVQSDPKPASPTSAPVTVDLEGRLYSAKTSQGADLGGDGTALSTTCELSRADVSPLASGLVADGPSTEIGKVAASNLISDKGLGVIAAGGGNVIAAGGGNVIAAGGGNVIAAGGGNVIAAGGGNVIAAGGGN
jgi:hypothetical protein